MAKGMTVEEVKKAKVNLEMEIYGLVKKFETKTGTKVGYISIQREPDPYYARMETATKPKKKKKRAIKNIEVDMQLDVI